MSKIIGWLLNLTKIGKVVAPVQQFLAGKKAYLAGLAIAIPAALTMIQKFSDQGTAYLVTVSGTPEWVLFMNGLAVMGLRAGIAKAEGV